MQAIKRLNLSLIALISCCVILWPYMFNFFSEHDILYTHSDYYGTDKFFDQKHQLLFKTFFLSLVVFCFCVFLLELTKKQLFFTFVFSLIALSMGASKTITFSFILFVFISVITLSIFIEKCSFKDQEFKINFFDKKIILISFLIFLVNIAYYWATYTKFHSFHWGEMTIFAKFWDLSDGLSIFIPRHGFFEIFLQKGLYLSGLNEIQIIHISTFIIKFFSFTDVYLILILVYFLTKNYTYTALYYLSYQAISMNPAIHATPIILTFFLIYQIVKQPRFISIFFLGLLTGLILFLRVDIGVFIIIASFISVCLLSYFEKNIYIFIVFIFGLLFFGLSLILLFGKSDVFQFLEMSIILPSKYNDLVWGDFIPTLQNGQIISAKILTTFMILLASIYLCIKEIIFNKNKESIPFIFLVLIMAATFKILLGRIDIRVFWFSAYLTSLPIAIYFLNQKYRKIFLILPIIMIVFISLPGADRSNYYPPLLKTITGTLKNFYGTNDNNVAELSAEIKLFSKYQNLIDKNKNKVTFLPFSSYSYVYFNTKPVGKYFDSYQVYPQDNKLFYDQLLNSNLVFWKYFNLDDVPDNLRLKSQLDFLNRNFVVVEKTDEYILFVKPQVIL